jgi:SnoaL-like domain
MNPDPVRALLDKQAIQETLYRYCRGVDRMDRDLTRSCWHEAGSADYQGMFEGKVDALLDWMWKLHATMQTHSHQMTNLLIEVDGDRAASETYVTVALRSKPGRAPARDILTRGRYVDRWSRREGRWAIDHRIYLNDWMNFLSVSGEPTSSFTGRRDADDPSYAAFAELHAWRGP